MKNFFFAGVAFSVLLLSSLGIVAYNSVSHTSEDLEKMLYNDILEKNAEVIDEVTELRAVFTEEMGHYYIVKGTKEGIHKMFYFKVNKEYMEKFSAEKISFDPCAGLPVCKVIPDPPYCSLTPPKGIACGCWDNTPGECVPF